MSITASGEAQEHTRVLGGDAIVTPDSRHTWLHHLYQSTVGILSCPLLY